MRWLWYGHARLFLNLEKSLGAADDGRGFLTGSRNGGRSQFYEGTATDLSNVP